MSAYDLIVIGTGGVGSAALYQAAKRGARVLGIEQFDVAHDRGSSHGQTRIIRQAYFEHPSYVPLVLRSYELWRELEHATGRRLLHQVGLLQVGPADGEVLKGVMTSAREHRLEVEPLSAEESQRRWPQFAVPDASMSAVYEPTAGYLEVENCVEAHVQQAQHLGAELLTGTAVRSWSLNGSGVTVQTEARTLSAERLIVTAGAWAPAWCDAWGLKLQVLRKSVFWYQPREQALFGQGCPCFLFETPAGEFYGFPALAPYGLKVAEHSGGQPIDDPANVSRALDAGDRERVERFCRVHLPQLGDSLSHHSVCLYTLSPDRHFVVDFHPHSQRVAFAAGLSGHGFKFTPVLGEALVQMVLDGETGLPIDFLRWRAARA